MGTNKVFILDKYFNELQKFWDTEKRLQGKYICLCFLFKYYKISFYIFQSWKIY